MYIRSLILFFVLVIFSLGIADAQTVSTYAGNKEVNKLDGHDTNCTFLQPHGLARDRDGNIYIADYVNHAIRKVSPAGQVTTFATKQTVPDLDFPEHVVVDSSYNVYYTNHFGRFIGRITPSGMASVFAGTGNSGQQDTVAGLATFESITGLTIYGDALFVSDMTKIRKVENGVVTTLAGKATRGNTDGPITIATFNAVGPIASDSAGNLFVADAVNQKIRKISVAGIVSTLAGSGANSSIDGTGAAASFGDIKGLCIERMSGILYLTEQSTDKIRKVTPAGVVTTLIDAGPCGLLANPYFCGLQGIVADGAQNLYVANGYDDIRKVNPAGIVSTFVGNPIKTCINGADPLNSTFLYPSGIALDSSGSLYIADQGNQKIRKVSRLGVVTDFCGSGASGSQNGTAQVSRFNMLGELAVNKKTGVVYAIDMADYRIRAIAPNGISSYLAGNGSAGNMDGTGTAASIHPKGYMCIDTVGNLYFTDFFDNVKKVTPAGVVSTYVHMSVYQLTGIAIDKSGSIYVAYRLPSQGIMKIDASGTVSSYCTGLLGTIPAGLACDRRSNIYMADSYQDHLLIITNGSYSSSIGGLGGYRDGSWADAQFLQAISLAFDESDSLYVADQGNNLIRKITIPALPSTGIPSVTKRGALYVSPNPNSGKFDVVIGDKVAINTPAEIIITNAIGQKIYSGVIAGNEKRVHLDFEKLQFKAGVYFVMLPGSQGFVSKFLISQ